MKKELLQALLARGEEIAESVGYRGAFSLRGDFKSYSGMMPNEFRHRHSKKN